MVKWNKKSPKKSFPLKIKTTLQFLQKETKGDKRQRKTPGRPKEDSEEQVAEFGSSIMQEKKERKREQVWSIFIHPSMKEAKCQKSTKDVNEKGGGTSRKGRKREREKERERCDFIRTFPVRLFQRNLSKKKKFQKFPISSKRREKWRRRWRRQGGGSSSSSSKNRIEKRKKEKSEKKMGH